MKKILITGASGSLGKYLCKYYKDLGYSIFGIYNTNEISIPGIIKKQIDLGDFGNINNFIESILPDLIIHTAALTNVDQCEESPELAIRMNVGFTDTISKIASSLDIKMIHISTDHLWDGKVEFVTEETAVCPLNVYGKTKAMAEEVLLKNNSKALVIRTNFFGFNLTNKNSLSDWILRLLKENRNVNGFDDVYFTPISIKLLTENLTKLYNANVSGIFHVAGKSRISKFEFARQIARTFEQNLNLIQKSSIQSLAFKANRPFDMSLSTRKMDLIFPNSIPDIETSLSVEAY